jgi:hypothetical protein
LDDRELDAPPRPNEHDALDDRTWFHVHPGVDFRIRWGAEGALWAIRRRSAERRGIADVLLRTVLYCPPETGSKDLIDTAWWTATYPYLRPDDRKQMVQDAQKRTKAAIKGRKITPPKGVIDMKTEMEREAIKAARRAVYDCLVKLGIESAFDNCTAVQIDGLIEAVWDALRASMQQQTAAGAIPI